jgi:methanethiol oxidase
MQRRDFLKTTASTALATGLATGMLGCRSESSVTEDDTAKNRDDQQQSDDDQACCDRTYASPAEAMKSAPETLLYVPAIYAGTKINKPDYMATVDVDPKSSTYGQVIDRLRMPNIGDELHHFGWNACSSCHGDENHSRRFMIVPGLNSGNIHIVDTADPKKLKIHKVISGSEIAKKTDLSTPHTVHCLADGNIMISMLGKADKTGPGGFLLLDDQFNIKGHWEKDLGQMKYNYDFWYQPRHNVMVSSEWAAPETVAKGFNVEDVAAGKYGRQLHFWNWQERTIDQTIDLGEEGMIPLEVRFHHNPDSVHGFVGAALSSTMWHWHKEGEDSKSGKWAVDKVISVDPVEVEGWPFPVPGLITDLVLSLDDRFLYFSNWLHGDLRQYDVTDPANPKLTGQVWLGGVIGHEPTVTKFRAGGGPQMLQLSLDGKRLYVTNSLYSPWDNQFYKDMADEGSWLVKVNCDTDKGGLSIDADFFVDFGKEPDGPARAHEMRFPGGDSTSDIWI